MAIDSTVETQGAIYRLLNGDETLRGLLTGTGGSPVIGIYQDRADQNAVRPYVVIRDASSLQFDTDDQFGQEHTFTFHTWTDANDTLTAKQIAARIYTLLHPGNLTIPGSPEVFTVLLSQIEFTDSFIDPDEFIAHQVQRCRVLVDEIV